LLGYTLPPAPGYLLELQREAGFYGLTWERLKSWQGLTSTNLNPWEANAMMRASQAYTQAFHEFEGKEGDPPWGEIDPLAMAKMIKSTLRGRNG
jgi:hypothetical protein